MTEAKAIDRLRLLPSVEEVTANLNGVPHAVAVREARDEISRVRGRILDGEALEPSLDAIREAVAERVESAQQGSVVAVINATGVILHTNLGRAPLAPQAQAAIASVSSTYSNLEIDLRTGERGSRHDHVEPLVTKLCSAEAAMALNNNAAAVLLALAAHANGRRVLVARGELIEIGGSFRVPEILNQSGAVLAEVGTTNRTRISDYEQAIGPETAAILRVHQSNFRMVGFTSAVAGSELAALAHARGIAFINDLGSGAVEPLADEPAIRSAVAEGADLVCFSADKLLGGPQAGVIAGTRVAVEACRSHPLARAMRIDKLQLAALEATLRLHRDGRADEVPAISMLRAPDQELRHKAELLVSAIGAAARVCEATARAGGGALPTLELPGPVCALVTGGLGAEELVARLRVGEPPVIARIADGEVILDPRTIAEGEIARCAECVGSALGAR